MKKWITTSVVAGLAPVLAVAGLFALSAVIGARKRALLLTDAPVRQIDELAIGIHEYWESYWWVFAPGLVFAGLLLSVFFAVVAFSKRG